MNRIKAETLIDGIMQSTKLSTDRKIDYPTHIENAGVDPDVIK